LIVKIKNGSGVGHLKNAENVPFSTARSGFNMAISMPMEFRNNESGLKN
jgi:hypothetical protein